MWNEKTERLVEQGKLVVLGVIQEQHAERCRLYRQWKQYKFPIVQDAFNSLGLAVVPVPILIDEFGVVVNTRPRIRNIVALVETKSDNPSFDVPKLNSNHVSVDWQRSNSQKTKSAESLSLLGDALMNLGSRESIQVAVKVYNRSLAVSDAKFRLDPSLKGQLYFRLGVAHRMLFDHEDRSSSNGDHFSLASEFWSKALSENPNQYIWRRRIQQYGPRQNKPYPFYDWVDQAQRDISDRGETPVELMVALTGSEIAQPKRTFSSDGNRHSNPDADTRITLDSENLVRVSSTVVPHRIKAGQSVRVHLRMELDAAKWNNESGEMIVWIDPPDEGVVSSSYQVFPNVTGAESNEVRSFEFEFKANREVFEDIKLTGFVLYYVCKSDNSQCLYRRQNFSISILIEKK